MQLSAANLIIASQQLARGAKAAPDPKQFAQALAQQNGAAEADAFAPLDFKQAASPARPPAAQAPAATPYNGSRPLGGNIDILV